MRVSSVFLTIVSSEILEKVNFLKIVQPFIKIMAPHRRQRAKSSSQIKKVLVTVVAGFTFLVVVGDFNFSTQIQGSSIDDSMAFLGFSRKFLPYSTKHCTEIDLVFTNLPRICSAILESVFSFHLPLVLEV